MLSWLLLISSLTACEAESTASLADSSTDSGKMQAQSQSQRQQRSLNNTYQAQFEAWTHKQDPQLLSAYAEYFKPYLKHPPSLYVLTLNAHPFEQACEPYRFALPPKHYWHNLVSALKVVEQLQQQGLFAQYQIVSVYRSAEANHCARGAKASKHLSNHAVDFQPLNDAFERYPNDDEMDRKMCDFWRRHGRALNLGLGLYGQQRYHIDTQGYRTWGISYTSASSPCLKSS